MAEYLSLDDVDNNNNDVDYNNNNDVDYNNNDDVDYNNDDDVDYNNNDVDHNNNDVDYNNNIVDVFDPDTEIESDSEPEREVICAVDESEPETGSDSEPEEDIDAESPATRERLYYIRMVRLGYRIGRLDTRRNGTRASSEPPNHQQNKRRRLE
ncbi:uncharacterized protein DDB_G0285917-like [Acyrthosiphon pisum]|uniref:Uncharacterized protein n=1 Tax=Acyrthosiphon pisum TaxID=7029 RepID=A0A8R2F9R8_ACYPI|nr:uncharacterized protein DDB_G0285917-like [Acyrthosiphon pisum]|eukprot:XP_008185262.1 PREDICTED: uncharacterized protein DDB_G0285917-like [Acyrthosiphon pisum]